VPNFRSACTERLGLIITVGGIILLGLFSPIYNWLLEIAANSSFNSLFIG
jgi:hypothetical protein